MFKSLKDHSLTYHSVHQNIFIKCPFWYLKNVLHTLQTDPGNKSYRRRKMLLKQKDNFQPEIYSDITLGNAHEPFSEEPLLSKEKTGANDACSVTSRRKKV